jgi:predicted metal-dependent HD superfamily phosphohydrolase
VGGLLSRLQEDVMAVSASGRDIATSYACSDGQNLSARWRTLMLSLNVDAAVGRRWWRTIHDRYTESHRFYHNLEHLRHMLGLFQKMGVGGSAEADSRHPQPALIDLAVFFHDLIYEPTLKDSRLDSFSQLIRAISESARGCMGVLVSNRH